nr:universal stress protein [Streptomyces sp. KO7888]
MARTPARVVVDGSPSSYAALRRADRYARTVGGVVEAIHVWTAAAAGALSGASEFVTVQSDTTARRAASPSDGSSGATTVKDGKAPGPAGRPPFEALSSSAVRTSTPRRRLPEHRERSGPGRPMRNSGGARRALSDGVPRREAGDDSRRWSRCAGTEPFDGLCGAGAAIRCVVARTCSRPGSC